MEIQYFGGNCVRITTKKTTIIVDGILEGSTKSLIKSGDVALFTRSEDTMNVDGAKLVINKPGEYEVGDISITGIPAKSYADQSDGLNNTIFKIDNEEVSVVIVGNVKPGLTDSQVELLGEVDVVIIPVGNNETGLSGSDALSIIKTIEPFAIIPTHYDDKKTKYSSPQASLEDALKSLAMEPIETVPKLKLKSANFMEGDAVKLIVLES